eukprot:TRINITY_DN1634_c0_g1_i1.p1 TRINITY_DN1634_c0_g1~~TRINITY_DN1634_c0_g1_i1.p1  ORF type:complete len:221 (-),score=52.90 TRINITY_DN1634_c0_g1_i1:52-714(-)
MFTGIVEELGRVEEVVNHTGGGCTLVISASLIFPSLALGDSVSVNGTCLTVAKLHESSFTVDFTPETARRTNLGDLTVGMQVHLERSLSPSGKIGGHFVQGHVDATGVIRDIQGEGNSVWFTIHAPEVCRLLVTKAYIAVDGTSLTVCDVTPEIFTFMLVPYTQQHTAFMQKKIGDRVNLEVDILGKYVHKFLSQGDVAIPTVAHYLQLATGSQKPQEDQ